MKSFKKFLIEDYSVALLILEGKGQHQVIKQFGPKILNLMQRDHGRLGEAGELPGTAHYAKFAHEPGHGTASHMHDYIMKHMGIPETPSYLNIQKPEDETTWNQHLNWVLTRYAQGDQSSGSGIQRLEDIHHRAFPALARYHGLVQQGKMDKASLSKWKNLTNMEDALQNADPLQSGTLNDSEYQVHDENEHWSLVTPHTSEAACSLGHGTKWCTTSGAFEDYSKDGPLYIMVPKKPKHRNEKYQLHIETKQFMDKDDSPAGLENLDIKDRPVTPKMGALLKLHGKASLDSFSPEEHDFIVDQHPHVIVGTELEKRLTKPQFLKVISKRSPIEYGDKWALVRRSPHIDSETISHILNNSHFDTVFRKDKLYDTQILSTMLRTPHLGPMFTREHFETILNQGHHTLTKEALAHENLPNDLLQKFKQSPSSEIRLTAMSNKNTTTDELARYLGETDTSPTSHARAKNLEDRVTTLMSHPNLPKDVFDDIFDFAVDPSTHKPRTELGEKIARELPRPGPRSEAFEHMVQHSRAKHDHMRGQILVQAMRSPHHEARHLDKIIDLHVMGRHNHGLGRDLADSIVYSPKATEEHYLRMIENAPQSATTDRPSKDIPTLSLMRGGKERITPRVIDALVTHEELDHPGSFEMIIKHPMFGESSKQILRDRFVAEPKKGFHAKYYESLMNGEK